MQKTGQMERTVDTEFQDEHTKFKTYVLQFEDYIWTLTDALLRFEKECQALQKESKAYLDAMRGAHPLPLTSVSGKLTWQSIASYDYCSDADSRPYQRLLLCCGPDVGGRDGQPCLQAVRGRA